MISLLSYYKILFLAFLITLKYFRGTMEREELRFVRKKSEKQTGRGKRSGTGKGMEGVSSQPCHQRIYGIGDKSDVKKQKPKQCNVSILTA
jgi:hypothetical protein